MPCGQGAFSGINDGGGGGSVGGGWTLTTIQQYITNQFTSLGLSGCDCAETLLSLPPVDAGFHAAFVVIEAAPSPQQVLAGTTSNIANFALTPLWTSSTNVIVVRNDVTQRPGTEYVVTKINGANPVGSFDTITLQTGLAPGETLDLYAAVAGRIQPIRHKGDLILGDADGSPAPLVIGTANNMVLATETGTAVWTPFLTLLESTLGVTTNATTVASLLGGLTNPMTTSGDMIYGGSAGVPTRLPAALAGKFLVQWGTPPIPTWLYLNLGGLGYSPGGAAPVRVPFVYLPTGDYASQTTNTTTHTVTAGVTRVEIEAWGGGGGGDATYGYNAGGGGGEYRWASLSVS